MRLLRSILIDFERISKFKPAINTAKKHKKNGVVKMALKNAINKKVIEADKSIDSKNLCAGTKGLRSNISYLGIDLNSLYLTFSKSNKGLANKAPPIMPSSAKISK